MTWFLVYIAADVALVSLAGFIGFRVAISLRRIHPDIDIENAPARARHLYLVIGFAAPDLALISMPDIFKPVYWRLPFWVDYYFSEAPYWILIALFGYLFGFAITLAYRSEFARRGMVARLTAIFTITLLGLHFAQTYPAYADLGVKTTLTGDILQTSGVSCAAASGANIAHTLGVSTTEKDMALLMGTRYFGGTSDARIHYGMRAMEIECVRVTSASRNVADISPPAFLFVDDPTAGPEGHVVALLESGKAAVIIDPLLGRRAATPEELRKVWRGKAMACKNS